VAALDVALGKGDFVGLTAVDSDELERTFEVVRVVVSTQQPALIAALDLKLVGTPAQALAKAALHGRSGQVGSATRMLEEGLGAFEKSDGFAAARVRAAWELDYQRDGGSAQRASAHLWRAVGLAPGERRHTTLMVAVERLLGQVKSSRLEAGRLDGFALAWLDAATQGEASPSELALAEAVLGVTGLSAGLRHDALAFLQDAGLRLNDAERATLVTRIVGGSGAAGVAGPGGVDGLEPSEVTDLLEDAAIAKARGTRDPLKQIEAAAEEARQQQRPDLAANLYSRLSPYDVRRLDAAVELVRLFASRGEPERARRYARTLIERSADPKLVAPGRVLALADVLAELGEWALARQAFARAVELGERSSRALLGLVRAHLQAGDEAAADQVANQWLDARPRRDQRAHDELAKVFANEGRLGRAIEVLRARLGPTDTMDPGLFSGLVDLLFRSGRALEVEPLAQDFVKADLRGTMRAHGVAAQKLMDAGRPAAALTLLEKALSQRPRDSSLLSASLMAAMQLRDPAAEDFAKRLVGEAPTSWDVWARVLEDLRGAGLSSQAASLATHGLTRASGEPRLLVARGRVLLLSGEGDRALADFAEALARADEPRVVATQVENELSRVIMDERLAVMTGRALALVPGRADLTMTHGNALLAAGRADEAERLFAGFTAETDRGQSVIAASWHRHGFLGRALDHWTRGFGELNAKEAGEAFTSVASSLVDSNQPERLDVFARLYVQALRGAEAPSLLPLALAYRDTGSHERYLEWLARADLESPSADTARALMLAHLDLSHLSHQGAAAQEAVLMHGERFVTRAVNAIPAGRPPLPILGQQLELLTQTFLARGESALLRRLVSRIEKRLGASVHTRLSGARAALHAGDLSSALSLVSGRFEPWRSQRDLLPAFGRLLDDLVDSGHNNAAMGLMERGLAAGMERDLQVASLRIFARSGHPELAAASAQRLATEMPALNTWVAADALATEGMPQVASPFARWALASGVSAAARDRMVRLLASDKAGTGEARLERALAAVPRFAGDLQERASSAGTVALSLGTPAMDVLAHKHLVAALEVGPLEAMTVRTALSSAAMLDSQGELERQLVALGASPARPGAATSLPGSRTDAVLDIISRQSPQRVRQMGDAAQHLSSIGLMAPALRAWQALHELQPGHLPTTLEAARTALSAGLPAHVLRLTRGLGGVESPPRLARLELAALAASHHELVLSEELASLVELEPETRRAGQRGLSDKAARVAAMSANFSDDQPAWEDAMRRLLASAPEESVVRLATARWLLDTSRPSDRGPTERARALLEPIVTSGTAPLAALATMLVVTLRLPGEGLEAPAVLAELDRRFPGPIRPEFEALIVDALLATSDPARTALLSRLLASPSASPAPAAVPPSNTAHLAPERRFERLATALEARQLARLGGYGTPADRAVLSTSTLAVLDATLAHEGAPDWSAERARLAIAIGHERDQSSPGPRSEALAVAVAAHGQARTSKELLGLYATTIARVFAARPPWLDGRGLEDAKAALAAALAFGARAGLYEGEARLLTPPVAWGHRVAETQLLLAAGDRTSAAAAFRRLRLELPRVEKRPSTAPTPFHDALAPPPTDFLQSPLAGSWLALGLQLVAADALNPREARGLLGACVAARTAPWSGLCRERLTR
jgi:tetratricopeptide (TPR) repeat protein